MGNSRGHWEGDTLVVETTDYSAQTTFRFPADYRTLKVVERFTRTGADAIDYQFTVYNPSMYTRPWTGVRCQLGRYCSACHEGNIGLTDVLPATGAAAHGGGRGGEGANSKREDTNP
jgi:hypothetical protein